MSNPRLENWAIRYTGDPYTPPELQRCAAIGEVYGHPEFPDGSPITTSALIVHDYGRRQVTTKSRVYNLGKIDPGYVQYMKDNGIKPVSFKVEDFQ